MDSIASGGNLRTNLKNRQFVSVLAPNQTKRHLQELGTNLDQVIFKIKCMNLNNFTLKSQEVIQSAQQLTQQLGHQQIENEHLFKGLLEVDNNVLPFVFKKLQVNFSLLENLTDKALESLPKVSGGDIVLSSNASKTMINAINLSKASKDGDTKAKTPWWFFLVNLFIFSTGTCL